jgi:hypothetical protein
MSDGLPMPVHATGLIAHYLPRLHGSDDMVKGMDLLRCLSRLTLRRAATMRVCSHDNGLMTYRR